ncbi:glycoside hydrolase superfamily [Chytridium lagenaria]|nr:glycoside hydrolase superfamily [Chytridium lagenaria]
MLFTATSAIVLALALAKSSHALDNGLGFTPAMGWNSWNLFACDINENITITIAEALIAKGLDKVGYKYVNLDDCWQLSRDNDGYIVVDDRTFPNGMKYLADYMHARDLKFGLYSSAGTYTCQGRPGSLRYEKEDAISYASWDVDYLKLDNCYNEGWGSKEGTIYRYGKMRDALNATGRPIYYSLCNWGESRSWEYGMELGNAWRTTGDICDSYQGRDCAVMNLLDDNVDRVQYSAPGGFSDLDMLEVGNGGMTLAEYRSHFSAWVVTKSPLLLGNDIRTMSDELVDLVSNTEVIAINQDPLGIAARRVLKSQKFTVNAMGEEDEEFLDVWTGPLQGGERVLMVLNRGETKVEKFAVDLNAVFFNDGLERNLTAPQPDFYIDENKVLRPMNATSNSKGRRVRVRNLWTKKNAGFATDVVEIDTIAAHDVVMLRVCNLTCAIHQSHHLFNYP